MSDKILHMKDISFKRKKPIYCQHIRLEYCTVNQTVTCLECQEYISGFKAFLMMVDRMQSKSDSLKAQSDQLEKIRKKDVRLIATRVVDKAWSSRKTVPTCPHCRKAIFPEDGFGNAFISKALALMSKNKFDEKGTDK